MITPPAVSLVHGRRIRVLLACATYGAMTGVAIDEFCRDARSSAPAVAYALPAAICNLIFIIVALVLMAIV